MDSEITQKKRTVSQQVAANCIGMSIDCRLKCSCFANQSVHVLY